VILIKQSAVFLLLLGHFIAYKHSSVYEMKVAAQEITAVRVMLLTSCVCYNSLTLTVTLLNNQVFIGVQAQLIS